MLKKPVESSKFRLILPWSIGGNLRLTELVLHGENLGGGNADVRKKNPVAVLVDEKEELLGMFYNGEYRYEGTGAKSGNKFFYIGKDANLQQSHEGPLPGWNFQIAENPKPGEYRYLQFSWKALSKDTEGIALINSWPQDLQIYAGKFPGREDWHKKEISKTVPQEWTTVRIDLWQEFKRPFALTTLGFVSKGGPAGFDQIILGRSESDLNSYNAGVK
jgi:hypothetical protein